MKQKIYDLLLFLVLYLVGYMIGFFSIEFLEIPIIWKLFVFDIISTIFIWICSLFLHNSSLYDAYWSLTPLVMLIYLWIDKSTFNVYLLIFSVCFSLWSIRLTGNWIITFGGKKWEDWRYRKYRDENNPIIWHIINFFGIMLMPTLLVFIAFVPVCYIFDNLSYYSILGSSIILIGVLLEHFADIQMHQFLRADDKKNVCQNGLWFYSRHPNYLGEITVWLGVYIAFIFTNLDKWYLCVGFLLMIVLFEFVSIPLAEKRHQSRRVQYMDYVKSTSRLMILPKKKK